MIDVKNKQIILFQNDRILGAAGDNKTKEVKFLLDKIQNGFDLSQMVAWIKIEPVDADEDAYNQLVKKETVDDKLVLTWLLTDTNLKDAGKLTVQLKFASPNFFDADDLSELDDDDLILPEQISGVSAPVWQSFKADFFVENSIDADTFYSEMSKDILTSAIANAVSAAEDAQDCLEQITSQIETVSENALSTASDKADAAQSAQSAEQSAASALASEHLVEIYKNSAEYYEQCAYASEQNAAFSEENAAFFAESAEESMQGAQEAAESASGYCSSAQSAAELAADDRSMAEFYKDEAVASAQRAESSAQTVENALKGYRHIYTCTLGANDTNISSFEITQDSLENPFCLKAFVIFGEVTAMPGAANQYVIVSAKPKNSTQYYSIGNAGVISPSAVTFFRYSAQNMGKWTANVVKNVALTQNADSSTYKSISYTDARELDEKNITAIMISCHRNVGVPFSAGTKLEIYGIDA